MLTDLKGFDHLGQAWSWPEFDELGFVSRRAHAWRAGAAVCGEPWPHIYNSSLPPARRLVRVPAPGEPADAPKPAGLAPPLARRAEVRDAEDRTPYLCEACLRAIT